MHPGKANSAFQRALNCLAHPLSFAAIGLLLLNDLLFQRLWPSWWTGKIGDAAWLVFSPFLAVTALAWLIPADPGRRERIAGWVAFSLIGVGFASVKAIPAFNADATWLFKTLTGAPAKLALDPTDLLTLPALALSWWLWNNPPAPPFRVAPLRWIVFGMAVVAVIADSPAPQNLGVTCLGQLDTSLLAFQEYIFRGKSGGNTHQVAVYRSDDGGLSWHQVAVGTYNPQTPPTPSSDKANAPLLEFGKCSQHDSDWQLPDPDHEKVLYAFIKGHGIYRSDDAGQTLRKEVDLTEPLVLDARVHQLNGNVIVAVGTRGLMVRTPDGTWQGIALDKLAGP